MLKFFLVAFLATALAEVSDDRSKLLERLNYSFHAPKFLSSIGLTTGELKKFSGHAMNIIRSKCPAVDAGKIFQVQKYIGKLIAKSEPVQGNSKVFQGLLETMTTCAKERAVTTTPREETGKSTFDNVFGMQPFHQFRTFWIHRNKPTTAQPIPETEPVPIVEQPREHTGIDSGLVQPENSEITTESGAEVPTRRIIKTTIIMRPSEVQEGIRSSGGFFNWIHNMFSRISGFMGNMFPFGGIRKKRDVGFESAPSMDSEDDSSEESFPVFNSMPIPPYQVFVPAKDDSKGKKAFGQLIDEMCRLYCDTCTGPKEIMNFKKAAKELLEFLFKEDSGIELAANKFLDDDFLTSIKQCD